MITKAEAIERTRKIRESLIATGEQIRSFIADEAWKPMGYASFAAWYTAELDGVPLAEAARNATVYQLLSEGLSEPEIVRVTGTPERTIGRLREQRDAGVPPEDATTRATVRIGERGPIQQSWVRFEVPRPWRSAWTRILAEKNLTVDDTARDVFVEYMRSLGWSE